MLIIAEPKSASTSLLFTLAKILKMQAKNGQSKIKGDVNCTGFDNIQTYHNTTVKRNYDFLKHYIESDKVIYKEHILPTKEHIDIIIKINKPVLVLLRDSNAIIKSYERIFEVLPDVKEKVNMKVLKEELEIFEKTYNSLSINNIFLNIYYNELVLDFQNTLKKILLHFQIKIDDNIINKYSLVKRNFSGYGLKELLKSG